MSETSNREWIKQRRLRDLRRISPDKILQLIDSFHADIRSLNQLLTDERITPIERISRRKTVIHIHYEKLQKLNKSEPMSDQSYNRVMSIILEEDNPLGFDYRLLKPR